MNQQENVLTGQWKSLGAVRGFDPGPAWRRRILLLAHAGFGKTTWASSNPRALVLDFESGAADVATPAAHRITIRDGEQAATVVEKLVKGAGDPNRPFDVVVFDTIDTWVEIEIGKFCFDRKLSDIGEYDAHGGGYRRVRNLIYPMLDRIWQAGYGWVCTGHLTRSTITVNGKEHPDVKPSLSPSFKDAIFKRCQYLLYADRVSVAGMEPKANAKTGEPFKNDDGTPRLFPTGKKTTEYRIEMSTPLSTDMKARVPLEENLIVGETRGWQVYVDAYDRAVAGLSKKLEPKTA